MSLTYLYSILEGLNKQVPRFSSSERSGQKTGPGDHDYQVGCYSLVVSGATGFRIAIGWLLSLEEH